MADTTMLLMKMYSLKVGKVGKVGDACTMMADTTMLLMATFLLATCQLPLTGVVWHGDTQDEILIKGIRINQASVTKILEAIYFQLKHCIYSFMAEDQQACIAG